MIDHVEVIIIGFGSLALIPLGILLWQYHIKSWLVRKMNIRKKARVQKLKYAKALVKLEDAHEKREGWLHRVRNFSWNMRGKKITKKQKAEREALRQQGLLFIEKEIDIRKYLYDQKGESHHRTMVQELHKLRKQLADKYQYTWLRNFYKP